VRILTGPCSALSVRRVARHVSTSSRTEAGKLGYREFLDLVLKSQVGVLEGRRYASRMKLSGLPDHKAWTS
jgi:hypothetical protein